MSICFKCYLKKINEARNFPISLVLILINAFAALCLIANSIGLRKRITVLQVKPKCNSTNKPKRETSKTDLDTSLVYLQISNFNL